MYTITDKDFSETVSTIASALRILQNSNVKKSHAKFAIALLDTHEIWEFKNHVTIEKIS